MCGPVVYGEQGRGVERPLLLQKLLWQVSDVRKSN